MKIIKVQAITRIDITIGYEFRILIVYVPDGLKYLDASSLWI
jgi:hypothetical protein